MIILLLVGVSSLGFLFFFRGRVKVVEVEKVERKDLIKSVIAPGRLTAQKETTLFAPLTGEILEVKVAEGDVIQAETVLAVYDRAPFELSYNQALSSYLAAKVAQEKLERESPLSDEIQAAESLVNQTREALEVAEETYDQTPNDATKASLNVAQTNYQNAQATLSRLKQNYPTELTRQKIEADLASAFSAYQIAKSNLEQTEIKAPHAGTILFEEVASPQIASVSSSKLVQGMTLNQGQSLFRVADERELVFEAEVDEVDIRQINLSQTVQVVLDAVESIELPGKVSFIDPISHQTTEGETVFTVKVELEKSDLTLKLGLTGDAEFVLEKKPSVLVIPVEAVLEKDDRRYVFVFIQDQLEKREVALGADASGEWEVVSGLNEEEMVVIEDVEELKVGQRVKVRK